MGIESAVLMSALASAGGAVLSAALAPDAPSPDIQKPQKPPKPTKTADRTATATSNAAMAGPGGAMSGNSGTLLTGSSGIDPSTLNLGRNTLLGQ